MQRAIIALYVENIRAFFLGKVMSFKNREELQARVGESRGWKEAAM